MINPNNFPLTRYLCYSDIHGVLSDYDSIDKKCLSISDSLELVKISGIRQSTIINKCYPDIDLNKIDLPDESFDFVVSDFVIEHVESDPLTIFKEQHRILKPNGFLVCTSAFVYPYHECPKDLWRYSNDTYEYLCVKTGFEIILNDFWGSLECLITINNGQSGDIVDEALSRLATAKDLRYKIVTWLVAKKI